MRPRISSFTCLLVLLAGFKRPFVLSFSHGTPAEKINIAIIGGGPSGLATGIALLKTKSDNNPTRIAIFESDNFQPKGASIQLSNAGWKALTAIDKKLASTIRRTGSPVTSVGVTDFSGKPLIPLLFRIISRGLSLFYRCLGKIPGFRNVGLSQTYSWHVFRNELRKRAQELAGDEENKKCEQLIRPGHNLIAITENDSEKGDGMSLTFDNGAQVIADVVLACDGVHSTVRRCLENDEGLSQPSVLIDEHLSVWRGTSNEFNPRGRAIFFKDTLDSQSSGLIFPAGKELGASFSVISPSSLERTNDPDEARIRLNKVLASQEPIDSNLRKVIETSPTILEHKLYVRDFQSCPWESGVDRVAFLGDAAHPLRPTGEGTALAMEDAYTIGDLARSHPGSSKGLLTPKLLRQYEAVRMERVKAITYAVSAAAKKFYNKDQEKGYSKNDLKRDKGGKHRIQYTQL